MPVSVNLLEFDNYIREHRLREVKSLSVHEPSNFNFHPEGLFAEEIFGAIGSEDRMTRFGYITLNMQIIPPIIYKNLLTLSNLYISILNGSKFAIFDPEKEDFIKADPSDENASTGYSFFMSHYPYLKFKETESHLRKHRITLINKHRNLFYERFPVLPAGLRELEEDSGPTLAQDDINKLYQSLISLSFALPKDAVDSDIFDVVKFRLQSKAQEIFEYIENIISGKNGFLQSGGYGSRNISLGTRNVITAATYEMEHPDDPQAIKPNETIVGIYQVAKGLQPIVGYWLKTIFFNQILSTDDSDQIALTDSSTFKLKYIELSNLEREKYLAADSVEKIINKFKNTDMRTQPVEILDEQNKKYYLCLVYDEGFRITYIRTINDAKEKYLDKFDPTKLRPITWAEVLYVSTFYASKDRYGTVTRYPVIEDGSCYPTKIHLTSTNPARSIQLINMITDNVSVEFPEYPILNSQNGVVWVDSVAVHTGNLPGLGGDFDGDTVSINLLFSDQANEECENYFNKTRAYISPEQKLMMGAPSDLIKLSLLNMSLDP